ncbi:hypothetical protein [Staphylococcus haemolyticus]|uniref:hypothetical protein n=1 Tax=Staphylococcus haemolyticus TaxID=1283 RepID=UPI00069D8210|nr:hypothetical protein [Staphylococcus haemolyticus]
MNKRYVVKINDILFLAKGPFKTGVTKNVFLAMTFEVEEIARKTAKEYGGKVMELKPHLKEIN